ncbi:hypothetical protein [Crassaminicella profunda]|uniref:hypothetical protein n=1 Tax=Crassaminicella profunda TaxID=1286698 RepID=UPI001CA7B227|nr:hypothetical protein [Crassaminicella profunda]QZY56574.1 hypothetical protein K7H06_06540 [Crassaminicella profunda]
MSFANQRNVLIHDRLGNVYNFRWHEEKIVYTYFDKYLKEYASDMFVDDCTLEYDAAIDEENNVYFAYHRKDGKLVLMSLENGFWHKNLLGGDDTLSILNLNLFIHNKQVHMIYCVSSNESSMSYRIYHHYYSNQEWKTFVLQDINRKKFLNTFQIIQNENRLMIGFYDFLKDEEQIYIKEFDLENEQWKNSIQVTSSSNDKLYLDMFMTKNKILHLTYSEYFQGNLVIKYEKYKFENKKVVRLVEKIVSNPSNCAHPTFIKQGEKLWIVWTEYEQVVSCYTMDEGKTWSELYLWKESKTINFFRYKFNTNAENIKAAYQFHYTFGKGYPEFSFIGFGPLENVDKIPLKINSNRKLENMVKDQGIEDKEVKNKKVEDKEIKVKKENTLKKELDELQKHIKTLEEKLKSIEKIEERMKNIEEKLKEVENLEERVKNIEEYLKRRRRGIFR